MSPPCETAKSFVQLLATLTLDLQGSTFHLIFGRAPGQSLSGFRDPDLKPLKMWTRRKTNIFG